MLVFSPSKILISNTISVMKIIEARPNLYYNTVSLNLVAYVKLFERTNNTQCRRSVGAVALNPSN